MFRSPVVPTLFSLIAALLWIQACNDEGSSSSEQPLRTGEEGESCTATSDCNLPLLCIDRVCQPVGSVQPMGSTRPEGADAGSSAPFVTRGVQGESCSARADCAVDLVCVNQVCSDREELLAGRERTEVQVGTGTRGESCQTRIDCEQGLICIENRCQPTEYEIQQTDKECAVIECESPEDCCDPENPFFESTTCVGYHNQCVNIGTPFACDQEMLFCTCRGHSCVDEKCVYEPPCNDASTCSLLPYGDGRIFCSADSRCVECIDDDDCDTDDSCVDEQCVGSCENDLECPYFHRCQNGACEEVGCTTDRECVAYNGTVLSICEGGECLQSCDNDLECSSPDNFQFRKCIGGYCKDIGCVTDEECRLRLRILMPDPGTAVDVQCRVKQS